MRKSQAEDDRNPRDDLGRARQALRRYGAKAAEWRAKLRVGDKSSGIAA